MDRTSSSSEESTRGTAKLAEGDRILDYRLLERIGSGGFADVFRARHEVLDRIVAIKLPRDAAGAATLRTEALVQSAIEDPGVVRVLEVSLAHEPPYLVLEHVEGATLAACIAEGPLPWELAVRLLLDVARALRSAHERGVVHGDLSPANVIVDRASGRARVTDFGLARRLELAAGVEHSQLAPTDSRAARGGTPVYQAPEAARGEPIDARADVFSWAVVLFEALTGRRPEGHDLPSELAPGVPRELDALFARCYARRERRPFGFDAPIAMLERLMVAETRGAPIEPSSPCAGLVGIGSFLAVLAAIAGAVVLVLGALCFALIASPSHAPLAPIAHRAPAFLSGARCGR